ncbi:MAG TPA: hypothetical protein VGB20_01930 [bacterium]
MREFASTRYRLGTAPLWQKRLYTAFLGFMLIGVGANLAYGLTRTGLTPHHVMDYYLGNPDRLMFEKTFQELLDVTHAHAFMMPVVLLVLGHLFFLGAWPSGVKRVVVGVAAATMALDIMTPWAVRFWHPGWAYVKLVAGYGLGASLLCLTLFPLYEMWRPHD